MVRGYGKQIKSIPWAVGQVELSRCVEVIGGRSVYKSGRELRGWLYVCVCDNNSD